MSAHAYTEDQLVEQPATGLLAEHGWQTVSALEETFGETGTLPRCRPRPSPPPWIN
jgi:type I restriction enzyme R subunit